MSILGTPLSLKSLFGKQIQLPDSSSSPYFVLRTLNELANLKGEKCPIAAEIIKNNVYVGDVICSTETLHRKVIFGWCW